MLLLGWKVILRESSSAKDNIFRLNFSTPTFDLLSLLILLQLQLLLKFFRISNLNKELDIIPDLAESWDISDDGELTHSIFEMILNFLMEIK